MKLHPTRFLFFFVLIGLGLSPVRAQYFNASYTYEQARAPISYAGLEDGHGFSMTMMFPSLIPQHERSLIAIQPGMVFDFIDHGSAEESIPLLDPNGFEQQVKLSNSSFTGGLAVRFSLAERFFLRPYLNAEVAARNQRFFEEWPHLDDDDCPEVTVERSWSPSIGMGGGVMVRMTPMLLLDLGVVWRQSGPLDVVPLESVGATEKGSYQYGYDVERARGQFLGLRVGVNLMLDDCHAGCDHTSCCAPSRHTMQEPYSPAQP